MSERMARLVFRMLVSAGVGAGLGLMTWLKGQSRSAWMADPIGLSSWSLEACLLGGAGIGALLALVLDVLGLDLPLFPQRQSGSEGRQELAFSAYLAELRAAKRRGTALPPPPAALEPELAIRAAVRDWSSGSAEGWIDRDSAERIQGRLQRSQVRLQILMFACVLTLAGLGFTLFDAVMSGGEPTDAFILGIYAIALACCAAVFWMGGTAWRVMAGALGVLIGYAACYFRI